MKNIKDVDNINLWIGKVIFTTSHITKRFGSSEPKRPVPRAVRPTSPPSLNDLSGIYQNKEEQFISFVSHQVKQYQQKEYQQTCTSDQLLGPIQTLPDLQQSLHLHQVRSRLHRLLRFRSSLNKSKTSFIIRKKKSIRITKDFIKTQKKKMDCDVVMTDYEEVHLDHFLENKYVVVSTLEEGFFSVFTSDIRKEIWAHIRDDKTFARASQVNRRWKEEMETTWKEYSHERGFFVDLSFYQKKGKDWRWILQTKLIAFPDNATTEEELAKITGPGHLKDSAGHYEGEFQAGKKHGLGKKVFTDGSHYVGNWINDLKDGFGTYRWADGTSYEGNWKEDKYHGFGAKSWSDGDRFEGQWKEDKKNGNGLYRWSNGDQYEGEWEEDKQHGRGSFRWQTGVVYSGMFRDNMRNDTNAKLTWPNGDRYEGAFYQNMIEGEGVYEHASGDKYIGQWKASQRHGRATYLYVYGGKFEGLFSDDERNGQGVLYWPDGDRYEGIWQDGGRIGDGKFVNTKGEVFFQNWRERAHRNYAERIPPKSPGDDIEF